jgi:hypothetical protein
MDTGILKQRQKQRFWTDQHCHQHSKPEKSRVDHTLVLGEHLRKGVEGADVKDDPGFPDAPPLYTQPVPLPMVTGL